MALKMQWIILALCLLIGPANAGTFAIFQTYGNFQGWQTFKLGAGGNSTGIDIECDGGYGQCNNSGTTTKVVRVDTYGAYVSVANGPWQQLVSTTSLPSGDPMNVPMTACFNAIGNLCGIYEIRSAPSNTNIAYMMLNGYLYKTTNLKSGSSATWSAVSGFTRCTSCDPTSDAPEGGNSRFFGPKMAIDPANPNNVIVCTTSSGCFEATDGETFSHITGLTDSSGTGGMLALFDPSSTSGGSTPTFYISSYGTGVYKCTGGLSSSPPCTLTTSTPTTHWFMTITSGGKVYLVANNGGTDQTLYSYTGSGSWASVSTGSNSVGAIVGVAVDPANSNNVMAIDVDGTLSYSTNAASSFGGYISGNSVSLSATDIPWLAHTNSKFIDVSEGAYDPAQSETLYTTSGFNVWYASSFTGGASLTWNSQGAGMEQLVADQVISPWTSGSVPLLTVRDQQVFYGSTPGSYPTFAQHGTVGNYNQVMACFGIDWASSAPADVMASCQSIVSLDDNSSTSTNGGSSWTQLSAVPSGQASTYQTTSVAYSSPDVAVWVQAPNGPLYEGCNSAGWTWTKPAISGIATSGNLGWNNSSGGYNVNAQIVVADRVSADTFYAYNYGGSSTAGIYKGVDSGSCSWTWTQAMNGALDSSSISSFYAKMKSVPGNAGEFLFTSGARSPGPYPHTDEPFHDCQDAAGTVSCTTFSNIYEVWAFGFGKAKTGGSGFPSIYMAGWANCGQSGINNCPGGASGYTVGIWRSTDHGSNWNYLSAPPESSIDIVNTVEGDANTYGLVYVGFAGSGYAYGQFNYLFNRDIDPSSNDNSPVGLNKAA